LTCATLCDVYKFLLEIIAALPVKILAPKWCVMILRGRAFFLRGDCRRAI
jgi:hypothetical protein